MNDIWFDFANLVILTIYFFNYGNPINANNIKVSFSQTRQLEDSLQEYARMQIRKKYNLKYPSKESQSVHSSFIQDKADSESVQIDTTTAKTIEERKQQKSLQREEDDRQAMQAADDSLEYFLGSTHYLNEMKKSIFAYYFSKKARYFAFIGLQVVTLLMTLLLAMLCRSLMSIGYLVFSVPLIMQITDFFHLD